MRGHPLAELVIRYRDGVSCQKKGRAVEWIRLCAFLRHPLCQKPATHVSRAHFAAYRDERLLSVRSGTVRRELSILHNMFEVAMREWDLRRTDNSVALVRRCLDAPHRERRLRPEEAVALYAAATRYRNPLVGPIIELAVETGLRRGELLGFPGTTSTYKAASC